MSDPTVLGSSIQFVLGAGPNHLPTKHDERALRMSKPWIWGLRGIKPYRRPENDDPKTVCLSMIESNHIDAFYGGLDFNTTGFRAQTDKENYDSQYCRL
jgi:hypothetical protein